MGRGPQGQDRHVSEYEPAQHLDHMVVPDIADWLAPGWLTVESGPVRSMPVYMSVTVWRHNRKEACLEQINEAR
jgi:hypothetical protein